jgi:hypothetical protein
VTREREFYQRKTLVAFIRSRKLRKAGSFKLINSRRPVSAGRFCFVAAPVSGGVDGVLLVGRWKSRPLLSLPAVADIRCTTSIELKDQRDRRLKLPK